MHACICIYVSESYKYGMVIYFCTHTYTHTHTYARAHTHTRIHSLLRHGMFDGIHDWLIEHARLYITLYLALANRMIHIVVFGSGMPNYAMQKYFKSN